MELLIQQMQIVIYLEGIMRMETVKNSGYLFLLQSQHNLLGAESLEWSQRSHFRQTKELLKHLQELEIRQELAPCLCVSAQVVVCTKTLIKQHHKKIATRI